MITSRQTPPAAFEDNRASRAQGVLARMLGLILATLFAVFVTTAVIGTADAQTPTNNRAEMVKELSSRYAEQPVALGIAATGGVLEVFASSDGSTWTMLLTMPDGSSTVIGEGKNWITVPAKLRGLLISAPSSPRRASSMSHLNSTPRNFMASCRRNLESGRVTKHLACLFDTKKKWRRRGVWLDRIDDHSRTDIGLDWRNYLALKTQIR